MLDLGPCKFYKNETFKKNFHFKLPNYSLFQINMLKSRLNYNK